MKGRVQGTCACIHLEAEEDGQNEGDHVGADCAIDAIDDGEVRDPESDLREGAGASPGAGADAGAGAGASVGEGED